MLCCAGRRNDPPLPYWHRLFCLVNIKAKQSEVDWQSDAHSIRLLDKEKIAAIVILSYQADFSFYSTMRRFVVTKYYNQFLHLTCYRMFVPIDSKCNVSITTFNFLKSVDALSTFECNK